MKVKINVGRGRDSGVGMEGEERREEGGFYGVESFPGPNYGDRSPPPLTLKYPVAVGRSNNVSVCLRDKG